MAHGPVIDDIAGGRLAKPTGLPPQGGNPTWSGRSPPAMPAWPASGGDHGVRMASLEMTHVMFELRLTSAQRGHQIRHHPGPNAKRPKVLRFS